MPGSVELRPQCTQNSQSKYKVQPIDFNLVPNSGTRCIMNPDQNETSQHYYSSNATTRFQESDEYPSCFIGFPKLLWNQPCISLKTPGDAERLIAVLVACSGSGPAAIRRENDAIIGKMERERCMLTLTVSSDVEAKRYEMEKA